MTHGLDPGVAARDGERVAHSASLRFQQWRCRQVQVNNDTLQVQVNKATLHVQVNNDTLQVQVNNDTFVGLHPYRTGTYLL